MIRTYSLPTMSLAGRKNSHFTKEKLEQYINEGKTLKELLWLLNAGYSKIKKYIILWGLEEKWEEKKGKPFSAK